MPATDISALYNMLENGQQIPKLEPIKPVRGLREAAHWMLVDAPVRAIQHHQLRKSIEADFLEVQARIAKAEVQGTVVNPMMMLMGGYNGAQGVIEPTSITMDMLRQVAEKSPPVAVVIGKRVEQAAMFCRPVHAHLSHSVDPGFHFRMTDRDEKATPQDVEQMRVLEQMIFEGGFCAPPVQNRPIGWQPGFDYFVKTLIRDSLTLDWAAIRVWRSSVDPKGFPVVAFCAEDAGRIRRLQRDFIDIENNVPVTEPYAPERTNLKKGQEIILVKVGTEGSQRVEEFTNDEVVVSCRRPRSDYLNFGYGYSELEEVINVALGWSNAMQHNTSRFYLNSLPRGIIEVVGMMSGPQMQSFQLQIQEMMQGTAKQWRIPVYAAPMNEKGQTGAINFKPFDMSPKDMEFSQFLFILSLITHCAYHVHPDETGYSAASPFRPPLSEASPESNLKNSMDTGLRPLMWWLQDFLNRSIVWRMSPGRRYMLEFVGLGDWDESADTQMRGMRLETGLSTPRYEWDELDREIPKAFADHPAWDFPAPFYMGFQILEQMKQAAEQQDQQQQMMQAQQEQLHAHTDMIKQGKMPIPLQANGMPGQDSPGNISMGNRQQLIQPIKPGGQNGSQPNISKSVRSRV